MSSWAGWRRVCGCCSQRSEGGGGVSVCWSAVYLRCVVKAVPMAMAAGAANLLAGVWAATGRWLVWMKRGRGQGREGGLTPPQRLLCDSLCQHDCVCVSGECGGGGDSSSTVVAVWITMLSCSLSAAVVNFDAPAARLSPRLPRSNASQSGETYRKSRAGEHTKPSLPALSFSFPFRSRTPIQPSGLS